MSLDIRFYNKGEAMPVEYKQCRRCGQMTENKDADGKGLCSKCWLDGQSVLSERMRDILEKERAKKKKWGDDDYEVAVPRKKYKCAACGNEVDLLKDDLCEFCYAKREENIKLEKELQAKRKTYRVKFQNSRGEEFTSNWSADTRGAAEAQALTFSRALNRPTEVVEEEAPQTPAQRRFAPGPRILDI